MWSGGSGWKSSRSEVAEWEEPRHPGPAVQRERTPLPPTLQHNCRHPSHLARLWFEFGRILPANRRVSGWVGVWAARCAWVQGGVQIRRLQAELQSVDPLRSLRNVLRARLIALPCLLVGLAVGGCGSGPGAGGADPASAVPAGTALYFEGVLRPEGSQKDDVLDAAGKMLGTDEPERKLREIVDRGLAKSGNSDVTWERDVSPWLGKKAGMWVAGVGRAKPGWVVLAA